MLAYAQSSEFAYMFMSPCKWVKIAISWALLNTFLGQEMASAQDGAIELAMQPPVILVNSIPVFRQSSPSPDACSLTAAQIAQLAECNGGGPSLISSDANARKKSHVGSKCDEAKEKIVSEFQKALAYRQTMSANAVKIHFAIAACLHANELFNETQVMLAKQHQVQAQLVSKGIPIPDDMLIQRLSTTLDDKRIENHAKLAGLRIVLAGLISHQCACNHSPIEDPNIVPSDIDLCERIEQAMQCRCDLITMQRLRGTINADTLSAWNSLGAMLSGTPSSSCCKNLLCKLISSHLHRDEMEQAVAARRKWLDDLIVERRKQISIEVELAFERKKCAALRWANAKQQVKEWETRIAQLEKLSDAHSHLAELNIAQSNRIQTEGEQIERWLEWHQADIDLLLAIGCETYANRAQ
jgi:hypothetical protein